MHHLGEVVQSAVCAVRTYSVYEPETLFFINMTEERLQSCMCQVRGMMVTVLGMVTVCDSDGWSRSLLEACSAFAGETSRVHTLPPLPAINSESKCIRFAFDGVCLRRPFSSPSCAAVPLEAMKRKPTSGPRAVADAMRIAQPRAKSHGMVCRF